MMGSLSRFCGVLALVLLPSGCGGTRDEGGQSSSGGIGGDGDGETGTSDDGGDDDGGDVKLDVGSGGGSGGGDDPSDAGCHGVDFLFVIDNSGSMADEQQNLVNSFPGFVQSIESRLEELQATDFHIMIVDTDAATIPPPNPACVFECAQAPPGTLCSDGSPCELVNDPMCLILCTQDPNGTCASGLPCSDLIDCEDECDCTLGAGKLQDQNGADCSVSGGQRYIQDGQGNLPGVFECLAKVGTQGSGGELQAQALIQGLSIEQNQADGCNEGFIRDDSILVVTLITDEEDSPDDPNGASPGDPAGWHASVVAAKKGNEEGIVMLGLVGDTNTPNAVCDGFDGNNGGEESPRLREFISSFQHNVLGSVCEPDYTSFFQEAVDFVEMSCEEFTPPG